MSKITFDGEGILNKLPSSVQSLLDKVGEKKVDSLEVFRRPLEKELTGALDFLTGDSIKKFLKSGKHDQLFHLGLIINNKFIFDKQENFHFEKIPKGFRKPNVEYSPVSNIPNITIKQLFKETRKKMGDKKFFGYDALKNNCQDFVVASLESIGAKFNKDFIKQDLTELVKNIPQWQQKFSSALIGVARDVKRIKGTGHCPMMGKNVKIKGGMNHHIDSSDEEEEKQQQPQNITIIQQPVPILPTPNPGLIPTLQNQNQSTIMRRRQQQQQQANQGSGLIGRNINIKDELKEIATQLDGAVKAHSQQSKRLKKIIKGGSNHGSNPQSGEGGRDKDTFYNRLMTINRQQQEQPPQPPPPPLSTANIGIPNSNVQLQPQESNRESRLRALIALRRREREAEERQGRGMKKSNPWLDFVKKVKKQNPNLTYKEVLKKAKTLYKK